MVADDVQQDPNDSEPIKSWNSHNTQFREWTMVVIRDSLPNNDCSVFPPINHENLHHNQKQEDAFSSPSSLSSSSSASSSSSFSPSDSDSLDPESPMASDSRVKRTGDATWWMGIGFEMLRSKLLRFASSIGGNGVVGTKAWSFASGAGIAAVVVMLWSLYMRARLRRRQKNLMLIIKEKDEKITRLLHQIAQLNEVLIARHRLLASKVPS